MTKSEVRAVSLSKLRLREDSLCWDVGAGTGSVAVEMALLARRGRVWAIEKRADAMDLLRKCKYTNGWYSEIQMNHIIEFDNNEEIRKFLLTEYPESSEYKPCYCPGFWLNIDE